ncbi:GNAT family N-acetyltransferase [Roseateles saccharophilus]|uniref:ElaA protein n=1 Tax=Roseateles saccharophilus TaxID=304 RepID=A0A4R3VDZ9_ROSSA|nr:GNAT family N-acetyltransferase [Roseateles saccharophilus]MDG0835538.1 GNAT family N-acetyltransferase [Roseateles saccharophilus]TCV03586.1 ElaA protein [Roseateles saccharophilus]
MRWTCAPFAELSVQLLHDALALRSEVFVVEQNCVFLDIDGLDPQVWHLLGHGDDGSLRAYARLIPPGLKAPDALIGRVVTAPAARGGGTGRALMAEAVAQCERLWPGHGITLHAQAHLQRFYAGFGFLPVGEPYIEDGIPHQEMRKETA